MKDGRLAQWITIGANVSVLVGLVVLIFELQQTRDLTRAQIRSDLSDRVYEMLMSTADNPQLADLMVRADNGDNLSAAEYFQYASRIRAMYRYWENVHYQYRSGLYEASEFERQTVAWEKYLGESRAAVEVWCSYRETVSREFADSLDSMLTTYQCGD